MELTQEQINANQIKYMELLSKLGVDLTQLAIYLQANDYFNKPYASQNLYTFRGGLCQYALNLYYELCQLVNAYMPGKYTENDVIAVALLKDIYRAELYEAYDKNVKDSKTGEWVTEVAYKYKENRSTFGDLNFNSYMIAKNFVQFTDEQIEAILNANSKETYGGDIHEIMRSFPLITITKMAELAVDYLA